MFKLIPVFSRPLLNRSLFPFCTDLEEHKPTPIQKRAQEEGIMAKQMLLRKYQLLKSTPDDSLDRIKSNYRQLKTQMNNRRYFIPNKKQYLLTLDQCYADILEVHEDYNYLEMGKERGLVSKRDIVIYELNAIKKAEKLKLIQTYETSALILLFFAVFLIASEEHAATAPRFAILDLFPGVVWVKDTIRQSNERLHKFKMENQPIVSAKLEEALKKSGIEITDSIFADGVAKRKQI